VAQTALTLVLVTGAALLVATVRNLERDDGGYARSNVIVATVDTRGTAYEREGVLPIHADILRRVRALPWVTEAGMSSEVPLFGGMGRSADVELADGSRKVAGAWPTAITPAYLGAAGVSLVAGRDFSPADNVSSEPVTIISMALARRLFEDRNPLGAIIRIVDDSVRTVRIVGLAADVKLHVREAPSRIVYLPASQSRRLVSLHVVMRVSRSIDESTVAGAIVAAAPGLRAPRVLSMGRELDLELLRERIAAVFATLFGVLALVLASIGIYGVVAYGVARRTTEIGIRMALGARAGMVVRSILRNSLMLVGAGVVLGAPGVFLAGRALDAFLYGLGGHDPLALLVSAGVLMAMTILASAAPAWRAARIDPMVALRGE
jgi:predicted permease